MVSIRATPISLDEGSRDDANPFDVRLGGSDECSRKCRNVYAVDKLSPYQSQPEGDISPTCASMSGTSTKENGMPTSNREATTICERQLLGNLRRVQQG